MAYYDSNYAKNKPRKFKNSRKRKPWRAYVYYNGQRYYLGHYATFTEATKAESTERLRRQRELLEEFPEEVVSYRQLKLSL